MLNVALTGNIAAGKSAVLDLFRSWGATVIDADQLVRQAQRPGTEVLQAIAFRFGREVILPGGELNRAALRGKVMGDEEALAALNAIVHPAVQRERARLTAQAEERGDLIVVNDIPLLFEAAEPTLFDLVVLVDAPAEIRRRRLVEIRGLDPIEAELMLRAQQPSEPKRARSHFIIQNAGTLEALRAGAHQVWRQVRTQAAHRAAEPGLGAVLLLAPGFHPGLPCGTLARYVDAGVATHLVLAEGGESEARRWSDRLGLRSLQLLQHPHRPLRPEDPRAVQQLRGLLPATGAMAVLLPPRRDPDSGTLAGWARQAAGNQAATILIQRPPEGRTPSVRLDVRPWRDLCSAASPGREARLPDVECYDDAAGGDGTRFQLLQRA